MGGYEGRRGGYEGRCGGSWVGYVVVDDEIVVGANPSGRVEGVDYWVTGWGGFCGEER